MYTCKGLYGGCLSYYGAQGYSDRLWSHPWMVQGYYGIHGYSNRVVGSECGAIHGWSRDVRVTMVYRDTLTGW